MTETLAAILTKFDTVLKPTPFAGGLYADHIPSTVTPTYPYCIIRQLPGMRIARSFGNKSIERPKIQFEVYHNGDNAALTAVETVATTFDGLAQPGSITLPGTNYWLNCLRIQEARSTCAGKDQNGDDVWVGVVLYQLNIQKN